MSNGLGIIDLHVDREHAGQDIFERYVGRFVIQAIELTRQNRYSADPRPGDRPLPAGTISPATFEALRHRLIENAVREGMPDERAVELLRVMWRLGPTDLVSLERRNA